VNHFVLHGRRIHSFGGVDVHPADVSPPPERPRRLYVVEDNPSVSQPLARLLRAKGYEVLVFAASESALAAAVTAPPDAALIDIHLPTRSGLELTAQLRDMRGTQLPVIIVSGDTSMETLRAIGQVGAAYFLAKPVTPAALLEAVAKCFGPSDAPVQGAS
jgi:DNA-binding response OmpR family regulator